MESVAFLLKVNRQLSFSSPAVTQSHRTYSNLECVKYSDVLYMDVKSIICIWGAHIFLSEWMGGWVSACMSDYEIELFFKLEMVHQHHRAFSYWLVQANRTPYCIQYNPAASNQTLPLNPLRNFPPKRRRKMFLFSFQRMEKNLFT